MLEGVNGGYVFPIEKLSFLAFQCTNRSMGRYRVVVSEEPPLFSSKTGSSCFDIYMYSGSNPEGVDSPIKPKPEELRGIQKEDD